MNDAIMICRGVPANQSHSAAQLYCAAFGEKLGPFLGAPERAAAFLASSLVQDRSVVALDGGKVVGIAGFKLDGRGLFEPAFGHFVREYGWSAPFRMLALLALERREDADCLLMDGIAVAGQARGKGIGTDLLAALEDHARGLGKTSIRLDVIDSNDGARRLYERLGFTPEKTVDIGPLRILFPFRRVTEMRKRVTQPATKRQAAE